MLKQNNGDTGLEARLLKWQARAMMALFALLGLVLIATSLHAQRLEAERLLRERSPLFGVSIQTMLRLGGLLNLAVGGGLLMSRNPLNRALLSLWAACLLGTYLLGAEALRPEGHCPEVVLVAHWIGVQAALTGLGWGLLLAWTAAASLWQIAFEWRRWNFAKKAAFLAWWRDLREKQ